MFDLASKMLTYYLRKNKVLSLKDDINLYDEAIDLKVHTLTNFMAINLMEIEPMSRNNAPTPLISEPYPTDNSKVINPIAECDTHLDISYLTDIQKDIVIQMANQFKPSQAKQFKQNISEH